MLDPIRPKLPSTAVSSSDPEPLVRPRLEVTVVDVLDRVVSDARVDVWELDAPQHAARKAMELAGPDRIAKLTDEQREQSATEFLEALEEPTWSSPRMTVRTDTAGRCTILDATDDTVLVAEKDGVGTSGRIGAVPESITLRLLPMARLHGIVRDEDDRPIAGAVVRFELPSTLLERTGPRAPRPVRTDGEGGFEVAVDGGALGSARAYVGMPERASVEAIFSVEPGEDEELELFFADGEISGRVIWDDGEPVESGSVRAQIQADHDGMLRHDRSRSELLGADGAFRLDGLRVGARYAVTAHTMAPAGVWIEQTDVVTGTYDLLFVLGRQDAAGRTLRGRVTDMATGAPVRTFEILLSPWSDSFRGRHPRPQTTAHETKDGRFEVPRLPVKWTFAVEVQAAGYEDAIFGPVRPDEWIEHEFKVGHAGTLTVEVAGLGGELIAGARVLLYDEVTIDGRDLGSFEREDRTSESGRLSWSGLKPGPRWLVVEHAQGLAGPDRVAVPSGEGTVVRCQLVAQPAPGRFRVVVRDAEGRALPDEPVELQLQGTAPRNPEDEARASRKAITGLSRDVLVEDLWPGVYSVSPRVDRWSRARFVLLEPGGTKTVELRLAGP